MQEHIKNLIKGALKNIGIEAEAVTLEHPADVANGDYSTNVALASFKGRKGFEKAMDGNSETIWVKYGAEITNPNKLAEFIKKELEKNLPKEISKIEVAGPGFINFYLSREFFTDATKEILDKGTDWGKNDLLKGKKIMVEYTQPNPFKPFHIGHLMSNAIGESLSRIVEFCGAETIRANYQGDVGPHVAKAIYAIMQSPEYIPNVGVTFLSGTQSPSSTAEWANWIGECYAKGSELYENDPEIKGAIDAINKKVYDRSDEEVNAVYDWGRKITMDAFEELYTILGTKFDHYFFESEMAPIGKNIVIENVPRVFENSDESEAIIFKAEKYDPKLHTRVFINSQGLPTYEAKEVGLTVTKFEKYNPDLSIVETAVEQLDYMRVVEKAMQLMYPDYAKRMKHVTHGMMRLASGKMSSRKGNVITGESLLRDSMDIVREKVADRELNETEKEEIAKVVGVAAVKYSILRSSVGGDIIYDFEKSISFEGDSGPYLQYTATRAKSLLSGAEKANILPDYGIVPDEIFGIEHLLYQFPEVAARAYETLEPHHIATYLIELASAFNSFYTNTPILKNPDLYAPYYIALVQVFHITMQNGLNLLGISLPEKM